jgi:hypothetical protein
MGALNLRFSENAHFLSTAKRHSIQHMTNVLKKHSKIFMRKCSKLNLMRAISNSELKTVPIILGYCKEALFGLRNTFTALKSKLVQTLLMASRLKNSTYLLIQLFFSQVQSLSHLYTGEIIKNISKNTLIKTKLKKCQSKRIH